MVPLLAAGEAALAADDPAGARAPLERAFLLAETTVALPEVRADIHAALARALEGSPLERRRAKELAARSVREYAAARLQVP